MNNSKGNIILLTIIAVATLLVAVAGTTFAYFGITMNGSESGTTIEVTSGTLSVEYDSNAKLNVGPSQVGTEVARKVIDVTGVITGSSNLNYEADLVVDNNSYSDGALTYQIVSENTSNNGSTLVQTSEPVAIPTGSSNIVLGKGLFAGPITGGATHKYTLIITYANQNVDADANATFEAHTTIFQTKK